MQFVRTQQLFSYRKGLFSTLKQWQVWSRFPNECCRGRHYNAHYRGRHNSRQFLNSHWSTLVSHNLIGQPQNEGSSLNTASDYTMLIPPISSSLCVYYPEVTTTGNGKWSHPSSLHWHLQHPLPKMERACWGSRQTTNSHRVLCSHGSSSPLLWGCPLSKLEESGHQG